MDGTAREDRNWVKPSAAYVKFGVSAHTIREWAKAGKVTSIRTLGGHYRYDEDEVRQMAAQRLQVAS
jgi:excisionase family DNA binding protein